MYDKTIYSILFSPAEFKIDSAYQPSSIESSSCESRCEVKDCKRQVSLIISNVVNGLNVTDKQKISNFVLVISREKNSLIFDFILKK